MPRHEKWFVIGILVCSVLYFGIRFWQAIPPPPVGVENYLPYACGAAVPGAQVHPTTTESQDCVK